MIKVVVGMSGGVDSSVTAKLLIEQGYEVIGLFMRNWKEEDEQGCCTAEEDYQDVKDVCNKLNIPYYSVDFSKEYYEKVFTQFVAEYLKGRTPNPDVLCNKEIKFDVFLKYAHQIGAEYVATGHYCNIIKKDGRTYLAKAVDQNKDQTYFLNQLSESQIEKVMFPIGNLDKKQVRELAKQYGLETADKKDSTGVCFIGERNFRQFLSQYIPMKEGDIKTMDGKTVGKHNGVFYYTLGQRKGLGIGGAGNGEAWFVLDKDVENNILYVSQGEDSILFNNVLECDEFNYINGDIQVDRINCTVRIRHRQAEQEAMLIKRGKGVVIIFKEKQRAIAEGQYCVVYVGDICIGGGVIDRKSSL